MQLAAEAGLFLDPWQAHVLECMLALRDGRWAAFEAAIVVPRQNGKNSILEARELAGLFLLGERLIIHSAHQFDTSLEAFRRILFLIENNDEFYRRVKSVSHAHGKEGIELRNGQRLRFRARTKSGGRGFSGDCVIFDESMDLPDSSHGAVLPTLSARPNPQVVYAASAVDQTVHDNGEVLTRIRNRGIAGGDDSLYYGEWSAEGANPGDLTAAQLNDPANVAQANPAGGIRITRGYVNRERRAMSPRNYAVERLGVGDWPVLDTEGAVIAIERWLSLTDVRSKLLDPVCFAFAVPPSRSQASIGVAGFRQDGQMHVEVVETAAGTGWVAGRLAELVAKHESVGVLYDKTDAGASLIPDITAAGVETTPVTAQESAQACGMFFDRVEQGTLHHLGTSELLDALRVASKRPHGGGWVWDRRTTTVDISPLAAVTVACFGAATRKPRRRPRLIDLAA